MSSKSAPDLYPLRFDPIFQYRLWGGRRLANYLTKPLPGDGPVGEAWILSDRDDFASEVASGPLAGQTLTQLIAQFPDAMLGSLTKKFRRFPLLLKFLDAHDVLSVQVHPADTDTNLLPEGERGKTEAWVVLEADATGRIFAGLNPGTTPSSLRNAIADKSAKEFLPSFNPKAGDAVFIPAGTVHGLGGAVVFEVQENSDVTFRLYDWDRVDTKTGQPRALHIEQALACINFDQGVVRPVEPSPEQTNPGQCEGLFQCSHFSLWRICSAEPFTVGKGDEPRVLVCLEGIGHVEHDGVPYPIATGDVMLLPAAVGSCLCRPSTAVTVLEIAIPKF